MAGQRRRPPSVMISISDISTCSGICPSLHGYARMSGRNRGQFRRVLSGIIFINRNGLRWCDAPKEYGPPKTLYNRWKRWGNMGVFARIMAGLASEAAVPKTVMIDATYLKAHRTATSLRSKKGGPGTSGAV